LEYPKTCSQEKLHKIVIGLDRSVKRALQVKDHVFDFIQEQKKKKKGKEKYIKRYQKRLSGQTKEYKRLKSIKSMNLSQRSKKTNQ
jgi:putative transposase